jgi:hypothetical protein
LRVLATVPPEAHELALAPLADFVAAPTPARFARARRQLSATSLRWHLDGKLRARHAAELEQALASLAELRSLDARAADTLALLPVDGRAAGRVRALAALIATHEELESRAEVARMTLLRRLRGRST